MKLRNKVNHFLYEIERNPLGPLVHCAELLYKDAKLRNLVNLKYIVEEYQKYRVPYPMKAS